MKNLTDKHIAALLSEGYAKEDIAKRHGIREARVLQVELNQLDEQYTREWRLYAEKRLREGQSMFVFHLGFPERILSILLHVDITTTDHLWATPKEDLLKLKGFGTKSWEFVRNFAHEHGCDHV